MSFSIPPVPISFCFGQFNLKIWFWHIQL
jgi:hypothetical protein